MNGRKLKENDYINIIDDYKNKINIHDIAEKYNICVGTIYQILKRENIPVYRDTLNRNKDKIINMYNYGMSAREIGLEFDNRNLSGILRFLKNNNVEIRDMSKCHQIYSINESYFDEIDTEEKAYILGLLYADGNHDEQKHVISLSLQEGDVDILEKINQCINSNRPIELRKMSKPDNNLQNQKRLSITNKHISEMMVKHGLTQKKSYTIKFPIFLDECLYKHFIRGFIDGDGSIGKYYITISSCSEDFILFIKEYIEKIFINPCLKIYHYGNGTAYNLRLSKTQYIPFLKWLYEDANIYLNRKYNEYNQVINR